MIFTLDTKIVIESLAIPVSKLCETFSYRSNQFFPFTIAEKLV